MKSSYEKPSLWIRIEDDIVHNKLGSYIYKNYIKTLDLRGNENVLDFGSGSGAGSRHLAKFLEKNGGHLTCVDISQFWMDKAKKRMKKYNNVDYLVGQLPDLNLSSNYFDAIYIFYSLHHVSENLRNDIVKEFYRILNEDGKIYIKESQREDDGISIDEIVGLMQSNKFAKVYSVNEDNAYRAVYKKRESKKGQ